MEIFKNFVSSNEYFKEFSWNDARVCVAVVLYSYICLVYYVECFTIAPVYLEYTGPVYNTLLIVATLALFNVLYNAYCIMFLDPSLGSRIIVQQADPSWSYCLKCETVRPPRAHHCRRCDTCVLRFDHHCTFLAQCIGHANIPYFVHLLFYVSFCCCMGTLFNIPYVFAKLFTDWSWYMLICCFTNPFPFLVIRWLSFPQFLLCLMTSSCAVLGPAFALFYVYHMRQIFRNQTSVEVSVANSENPLQIAYEDELRPINYDLGWRANFEQILGKNWLICFLLPFLPAKQTSDGLHFPCHRKAAPIGDGFFSHSHTI